MRTICVFFFDERVGFTHQDGHARQFFNKFLDVGDISWDSVSSIDGKPTNELSFNQLCKWYVEIQATSASEVGFLTLGQICY